MKKGTNNNLLWYIFCLCFFRKLFFFSILLFHRLNLLKVLLFFFFSFPLLMFVTCRRGVRTRRYNNASFRQKVFRFSSSYYSRRYFRFVVLFFRFVAGNNPYRDDHPRFLSSLSRRRPLINYRHFGFFGANPRVMSDFTVIFWKTFLRLVVCHRLLKKKKNKMRRFVSSSFLLPKNPSRARVPVLHLHFSVALNNYFISVLRADSVVLAVFAAGAYGYKNRRKRFYSSTQMMAYRFSLWLRLFVHFPRFRFLLYFHGDVSHYRHRAFLSGFSRRFWLHRVSGVIFCPRIVYNGCRRPHFPRTGRKTLIVI